MRYILPLLVLTFCLTPLSAQQSPTPAPASAPIAGPARSAEGAASTTTPSQKEKDFVDSVTCSWPTDQSVRVVDCSDGLSVTGDDSSSIYIRGIPAGVAAVVMTVRTAQFGTIRGQARLSYETDSGVRTFTNVLTPAGEAELDVYKTRMFFPAYPTGGRSLINFLFVPAAVREPKQGDAPWVVIKSAHPLSITLTTNGQPERSVTFHVDTRFQRWHIDTGGFYAYSWARDDQILTRAVKGGDPNSPKTEVVAVHAGDRNGPATGVTFFFHPSNYPDWGFEFGTATNGANPSSWYLGTGGRLRTFGDHTLLTIAAGVSRVSVKRYPSITAGTYDSDDPRLMGRQGYVTKPYISLGLGVNFGGNESEKTKDK